MNHDNSLHSSLTCKECQKQVMHATQRVEKWRWCISYIPSDEHGPGKEKDRKEFITQDHYTEQEIKKKYPVSSTKLERINFTKQWMDK